MRNHSLDLIRGVLIISVIVGHIVLGSIHQQFVRYAIYAVHMPLFIALTGYLINPERLQQQSWWQSAMQYWQRVALPFIPAFLFFTVILGVHAYQEARLDTAWLISSAVTPYYHLWYIPTLVLWVVFAIFCVKLGLPILLLVLLSVLPTLGWAGLSLFGENQLWSLLIDKKVFFYLHFFLFGMLLRAYRQQLKQFVSNAVQLALLLVVVVSFAWVMTFLGQAATSSKAFAWLVLNWALALLCIGWALNHSDRFSESNLLVRIGRYSLPIYLWHVVPLFLMKGFDLHESHTLVYYGVAVASSILIVLIFVSPKPRPAWAARWLYGESPQ